MIPGFGEPAPTFSARSHGNPRFVFDTVAGRYILLGVFGSANSDTGAAMLAFLAKARRLFDDERIAFFGVSSDPADEHDPRIQPQIPGVRWFFDPAGEIARLYGFASPHGGGDVEANLPVAGFLLVDPSMRLCGRFKMPHGDQDIMAIIAALDRLPPPHLHTGREIHAPILIAPMIFEPEFCRRLIAYYDEKGGTESGFMRQIDGKTVPVYDYRHKRRSDVPIEDQMLCTEARVRIQRRLVPEIEKAFQFKATRMERYIVACYDAETGGHFNAHRDNTTSGTKHRKFAVSINLNADFEGGEICFPEFSPRSYKPPPGGAVVFSCSLLHRVYPMTSGRRFAFLPFLYDDAAAELRERNQHLVSEQALDLRQNLAADAPIL